MLALNTFVKLFILFGMRDFLKLLKVNRRENFCNVINIFTATQHVL